MTLRGLVLVLAVAVVVAAMGDEATAKMRHSRSRDRSPRDAESRSLFGMENYTLCVYKVRRWPQKPRHSPASLTEVVCQGAGNTCSNGEYRCVQLTTTVNVTSLDTGEVTQVPLRYACACGLLAAEALHKPDPPSY